MHTYHFQHKVRVLLSNNANIGSPTPGDGHSLTVEGVTFSSWERNPYERWKSGAWLAEADIYAKDLGDAMKKYSRTMSRIVSRIAFVGQAYINDRYGPMMVRRTDKDFAFTRSIILRDASSLDFMDEELRALELLLANKEVPDTFYFYWNDAVNTAGYTGKLMLMLGAIDSFAVRGKRRATRMRILGEELADELYADGTGLRNRLIHGEYLNETDGKNYVELIHKKVLEHFNKDIIGEDALKLDILRPQRHFDENYEGARLFIRQTRKDYPLDIYSFVDDTEANDGIPQSYDILHDKNLWVDY